MCNVENNSFLREVKASSRCSDTEEDLLKFITPEVASHGSPHDYQIRFCFETHGGDASIADNERDWEEAQKKRDPTCWDKETSDWVGGSRWWSAVP